jgi:putative DNA primase/helicase
VRPLRRRAGKALTTLRTDLGNAERFVARHGRDLRYVAEWKRWLVWDGKRWAADDSLEVQRRAQETIRSMWAAVADLPARDQEDWAKHILRSETSGRLSALLECARANERLVVRPAQLDADPWLVTCENGVLDLRTGQLGPHDRALLMTKLVPASFDPEARCDRWERFLHRIMNGNTALIDFLRRAVGYSLTGQTSERCLFFLYGMGANGKSTFLEVLRALLARYAQQADFTSFLETPRGDGPRNDIARLIGARVVTSSEVGEGKRLNESLVKTLTGTDTVTARFLHAEFFEFKPQFKLWLAANHRPVVRGTDPAIWDRVRLIPFTVSIPPMERDSGLLAELLRELPGILAWSVAGCLEWLEKGLGTPPEVAAATEPRLTSKREPSGARALGRRHLWKAMEVTDRVGLTDALLRPSFASTGDGVRLEPPRRARLMTPVWSKSDRTGVFVSGGFERQRGVEPCRGKPGAAAHETIANARPLRHPREPSGARSRTRAAARQRHLPWRHGRPRGPSRCVPPPSARGARGDDPRQS